MGKEDDLWKKKQKKFERMFLFEKELKGKEGKKRKGKGRRRRRRNRRTILFVGSACVFFCVCSS